MQIELRGMSFYAQHGCYEEEKITGNRFEVDLLLRTHASLSAQTDQITDALNYQDAYQIVAEQIAITSNLLEHVAARILSALFAHFDLLDWAEVRVAKLSPAMGGKIDRVLVSLEQSREPAITTHTPEAQSLLQLVANMRRIRRECPWDAQQTIPSLIQYTIEEVHELFDAITEQNDTEIRKELGDLLMHVLFYAVIGEEEKRFSLKEIADSENEKIIYRHPHVFQAKGTITPEEVEQQWEALKLKEKGGNKTVLGGVPRSLPPLVKALRVQEKTSAVGFDWNSKHDIWKKVAEELQEVHDALAEAKTEHIQEEFGDLLFTVINAARLYKIDPSLALEYSNRKFIDRFNLVEAEVQRTGREWGNMSLEEMDALWQRAKEVLKKKRS